MKIVQVIHCCSPGGAEIYIKNLLIYMKKKYKKNKYQLWVIHDAENIYKDNKESIEFEKSYVKDLIDNGIEVKFVSKKDGLINRILMMKKINQLYSDFKPDVIHCHLETVTFHIVSSLLFKRVKILETIHSIKINRPKLHRYFLNYKISKYISIADSCTQIIKKEININDKKLVKIYNGIDIEKFSCNREEFSVGKPCKIVAIGRLTEAKNYLLLIKSFKRLIDMCNLTGVLEPTLSIYGQGELESELKEYVSSNKIKNIDFMGITNSVEDVLKNNDIYVMSSIYEGFSISLIEALASGISIVCTDVGGNSEIVTDSKTGILVESNNEIALATGMKELITNPEKRSLFYNNCNDVKYKYSINYCVDEHINMYNLIIK